MKYEIVFAGILAWITRIHDKGSGIECLLTGHFLSNDFLLIFSFDLQSNHDI